jgi:amino acid transporter
MADDIAATTTAGEDERRLHELGYAQELMRRMSGFSNFAVSFTIISILSGCLTLYGYGMNTGGPAIIVWGWPIVGLFTLTVGLAMAEVCSSFPTAGGLYYWSAKLARKNGPAWSWFTGWFNFLGPGRGDRGHRLRLRVLHQRVPEPDLGASARRTG